MLTGTISLSARGRPDDFLAAPHIVRKALLRRESDPERFEFNGLPRRKPEQTAHVFRWPTDVRAIAEAYVLATSDSALVVSTACVLLEAGRRNKLKPRKLILPGRR
jgi:hypothetical protein